MMYEKHLQTAVEAAIEAGEHLRRELHRPGGPRGRGSHADADEEAEWMIRKRLVAACPTFRYRGEETGSVNSDDPHVWLVDPNDGTTSYLRGERGSAVSIALVRSGVPVLGVVYAYAAPDDSGDLFYWAEGSAFKRNEKEIVPAWDISEPQHTVILVSQHREYLIPHLLECISPYRYIAYPSIAYRLALAAAGDGAAAVSWHRPGDWDYAGGHALLRAVGGILVNEDGNEITYREDGFSKVQFCFGGHPTVVRDLSVRNWKQLQSVPGKDSDFRFARLKRDFAVPQAGLLSRAQGCLLGQLAGDALGQQVEFLHPDAIQQRFPSGVRIMKDGGSWQTLAGQPTDDSEMALMLARTLVSERNYNREKVAQCYYKWYQSNPFDMGNTIRQALQAITPDAMESNRVAETMEQAASNSSQANGSLMRISPLGIFGYRHSPDALWEMAVTDSKLTHPHAVCQQATGLYVFAIACAIREGLTPRQIYNSVLTLARSRQVAEPLLETLISAQTQPPQYSRSAGWVLIAFQNAFYQLLTSNSFEEALMNTANQGGDSDTNAAIAGALLGAVHGLSAFPLQWRNMVLSCRPHPISKAIRPRPYPFWPVDALQLSELLLTAAS